MVKPRPTQPASHPKLKEILELFGNDRAYTVIRSHGNSWKVLFEGDYVPSIVKFENEKPVITKEDS